MFRPIPDYYTWELMENSPREIVALGFVSGDRLFDIRATVERLSNGEWLYLIANTDRYGIEPSKKRSDESSV
jgi:hypothetical protein